MVVVLVVIARTATPANVADALFRANGRAANMVEDCSGWRLDTSLRGVSVFLERKRAARGRPVYVDVRLWGQPSAFTTASPICAVPTLVVPSL